MSQFAEFGFDTLRAPTRAQRIARIDALATLLDTAFVVPGTKVYQGMIIGQNAKDNDLDVNPTKAKQLTNIRTTSKDEAVRLTPIVPMTLEQAMAYIQDDELVEVTPKNIRLRKRELLPHMRKRAKQAAGVVSHED